MMIDAEVRFAIEARKSVMVPSSMLLDLIDAAETGLMFFRDLQARQAWETHGDWDAACFLAGEAELAVSQFETWAEVHRPE